MRLADDEIRAVLARAEEIQRHTLDGDATHAELEAVIEAAEEVGIARSAVERALRERFNLPPGCCSDCICPPAAALSRRPAALPPTKERSMIARPGGCPSRRESTCRHDGIGLRALLLALAGIAVLATAAPATGQDLHPSRRPSPIGIAKTHIGDTYVKVTYGRPYIRGRSIFGAPGDTTTFLVPFGELWRTGANEATELTNTGPLMVAGTRLDAGTYAIFTVPGAQTWSVRFSPQLGLDGTNRLDEATGEFRPGYDPAQDVLQIEVPAGTTDEVVDQFTLEFERTPAGADLVLRWERTEVRVPLSPPGG